MGTCRLGPLAYLTCKLCALLDCVGAPSLAYIVPLTLLCHECSLVVCLPSPFIIINVNHKSKAIATIDAEEVQIGKIFYRSEAQLPQG